jgi:hypothetical protein
MLLIVSQGLILNAVLFTINAIISAYIIDTVNHYWISNLMQIVIFKWIIFGFIIGKVESKSTVQYSIIINMIV